MRRPTVRALRRRVEWRLASPVDPPPFPLVIGASGGSGTRVVARLLRRAGVFLGADLNQTEDSLLLARFLDRWIDRFASGQARRGDLERELRKVLRVHLADAPSTATSWGWKEPRSMYLLPALDSALSGLRFLHVVRDGRDIALSRNQNQLRRHSRAILASEFKGEPEPVRSIALWSRANGAAADYGERALGRRYLRVRFEDLCARPEQLVADVLSFAGVDADAGALARQEVRSPPTLGRWRCEEPGLVEALERRGCDSLVRFGYLDSRR